MKEIIISGILVVINFGYIYYLNYLNSQNNI